MENLLFLGVPILKHIRVHFNVFACFGIEIHACFIQVACLIEVDTKTGFTVVSTHKIINRHQ